jgi:exportin-5
MHDGRACSLITRVLRTIIGEFTLLTPVATEIREFISTEVFKGCIASLHDPYFVDVQSDLATLIASILVHYATLTETPKNILLSLPGMSESSVTQALQRLFKADKGHGGKQQRAVVLQLLEGLRGVSVSEQGKYPKPDAKKMRSAMQERYMSLEQSEPKEKDQSPDLGGVADMFA